MPEDMSAFDPSKFSTLEDIREAYPEEADKFREVELGDYKDEEAFKAKQGGFVKKTVLNEDEARVTADEKIRYDVLSEEFHGNSAMSGYQEAQKSEASLAKYNARLAEYLKFVDKHYQDFQDEYGVVKGATVKDFLASYKKYLVV